MFGNQKSGHCMGRERSAIGAGNLTRDADRIPGTRMAILAYFHVGEGSSLRGWSPSCGLYLIPEASAEMSIRSTSREALPPESPGKGPAPAPLAPAEIRKGGGSC